MFPVKAEWQSMRKPVRARNDGNRPLPTSRRLMQRPVANARPLLSSARQE